MPSVFKAWGMRSGELRLEYPCDRFLDAAADACYRGVTIRARPEVIFRWLCQMRIAPYSYDWIDNLGRRSPKQLTPGLESLEIGQQVMTIFELIDFEKDRQVTIRIRKSLLAYKGFGDTVVSYLIKTENAESCRLLVKILLQYPRGVLGWLTHRILPLGDLIMMRRQLLNFKKLAEETEHALERSRRGVEVHHGDVT